ncbi:MAG: metalloregulator ArsR/SmtB family transcription factor [candidate division KSB1 bacterium]|nr:metalloregulator ArsR/SmtB family transcription factor [candidate division KSB1 bacterium]MDZ7365318.1 metalloregulator ArsR/SmtB family transcription factor [candidate division KSB1 bacterium]MDZ7403185.1 metalloregulator ArsR/SmtB family transcription factor [candidate division KSB1 bacterium]
MSKTAYDFKAAVLKALAHPNRLRILEALRCDRKVCNCEIGPKLGLEQSNLSRHLLALSEAGLVVARKDGVRMMYRVTDPRVFKVLDLVGEMIKKQFVERAELLEIL